MLDFDDFAPNPSVRLLSPGRWEATDDDPWFATSGSFAPGQYVLDLDARIESEASAGPVKVYFGVEPGRFFENNSFRWAALGGTETAPRSRLPFMRARGSDTARRLGFVLPVAASTLRFDPVEHAGTFLIKSFRLHTPDDAPANPSPGWEMPGLPSSVARPTALLPNVVPLSVSIEPALSRDPHLNVLVPSLAIRQMTGGPNTAIAVALGVARAGVPVRLISTDARVDQSRAALWEHLSVLAGASTGQRVDLVDAWDRETPFSVGEHDVFMATAWWTAHMASQASAGMATRRFLYFIQDYEPGLYPWSTRHALATETYGFDYEAIVNQSGLLDFLIERRVGRFAHAGADFHPLPFEPPVDRSLFHLAPGARNRGRRRLVFYGRPSAPRNLFEIGIAALRAAILAGAFPPAQWELVAVGEREPGVSFDFGEGSILTALPWLGYEGYARLLRDSDVGLALMLSPHTSYPPLEMAAAGMCVVTNTFATKTAERLAARSPNIIAAPPTVAAIAEALVAASRRAANWPDRVGGAEAGGQVAFLDAIDEIVPGVIDRLERCRATTGPRAPRGAAIGP